jgi:hypothetical protein
MMDFILPLYLKKPIKSAENKYNAWAYLLLIIYGNISSTKEINLDKLKNNKG